MRKRDKSSYIPTFHFINLGCPKNIVDAQRVADRLEIAGFEEEKEVEKADLIVLTTCAFIEAAEEESVDEILRIGMAKGEKQVFAVLGCLVSREGDKLLDLFSEVDIFLSASEMVRLPEKLAEEGLIEGPDLQALNLQDGLILNKLFTPRHIAYLKISDGCSNNCSYCLIPSIRGPLSSRKKDDILSEASRLSQKGVRELVVIAQDTGVWGKDLEGDSGLCGLLEDLSSAVSSEWIRLMYLHPGHVDVDELLRIYSEGKILPYLDIPIQHVSGRILSAMGRGYGKDYLMRLFSRLKSEVDNLVIRTTVMVGFPGENEDDFEELVEFLERFEIDHVGVFVYSAEEGTKALNYQGAVNIKTAEERKNIIDDIQMDISNDHLAERTGAVERVLVDEIIDPDLRPREGVWGQGRFYGQAYEIDGVVFLSGKYAEPGEFAEVRIDKAEAYDLFGGIL
ncbi:MAG: 30S ribosomal protein S12 methylthiotransferase RimO [Candidatus Krumholzibacteriota bacterium]|nr:30S ribosomal protein S12 methylthiotransferase RimO [Candidatus Krumholzibacteriota bacterium]